MNRQQSTKRGSFHTTTSKPWLSSSCCMRATRPLMSCTCSDTCSRSEGRAEAVDMGRQLLQPQQIAVCQRFYQEQAASMQGCGLTWRMRAQCCGATPASTSSSARSTLAFSRPTSLLQCKWGAEQTKFKCPACSLLQPGPPTMCPGLAIKNPSPMLLDALDGVLLYDFGHSGHGAVHLPRGAQQ